MSFLQHKKLYLSFNCEIHGEADHALYMTNYFPSAHLVLAKMHCCQCYSEAQKFNGTYAYIKYTLHAEEWLRLVNELGGEAMSGN